MASALEVGMKLHAVFSLDGEFYPAVVSVVSKAKNRSKAPVQVEFTGYNTKEWKSLAELRSKKLQEAYDYSELSKGTRLQAMAEDGKWYAADVVTVAKDKKRAAAPVKVNFVGYNSASDEWVGGESLRSKTLNIRGSEKKVGAVSSAKLDWKNLTFDMTETVGRAQVTWKDGKWGDVAFEKGSEMKLHIFANVLHYGQTVFEGLKAFHCSDGQVRVFKDRGNYERIQNGCRRMKIPEMDYEVFKSAIDMAVQKNRAFIPPPEYCSAGSALYIRPLIIGSGAQVGLHPSKEYIFMVMVVPVGPYFKTGFKAIPGQVITDYDRAAPEGVGAVKCAGNYAADLLPSQAHKDKGFPIGLYLDSKEKKYVEEFNGANLIAITKEGAYVTPESASILPSITNGCLIQLAKDRGMVVERRPMVFKDEVANWTEVGAVGTAAVVCPIKSLTMGEQTWNFSEEAKVLQDLFKTLTMIQRGEAEDPHGWVRTVAMN